MFKRSFIVWLCLFCTAAFLPMAQAAGVEPLALARLLKVNGTVKILAPDGLERALTSTGQVFEGEVVQMGPNSDALLVFSTGSVAKLKPDSIVFVEKLRAETSDRPGNARSDIQLQLYHGEIVSEVKPLRQGSTYAIHTPLGTAGVRGTGFATQFSNPAWSAALASALNGRTFSFPFPAPSPALDNLPPPPAQTGQGTATFNVITITGTVAVDTSPIQFGNAPVLTVTLVAAGQTLSYAVPLDLSQLGNSGANQSGPVTPGTTPAGGTPNAPSASLTPSTPQQTSGVQESIQAILSVPIPPSVFENLLGSPSPSEGETTPQPAPVIEIPTDLAI